jgi:hypothetical protein
MGMKYLERLVESLIGEPVEFIESEGSGSGIDSQFSFYGQDLYGPKPTPRALEPDYSDILSSLYPAATHPKDAKVSERIPYYGEESYTPAQVPKVISTPAPAPDTEQAKEKSGAEKQIEDILLHNPGLAGGALMQQIKALGIEPVDMKLTVGDTNENAPSVQAQIESILLKTPEISAQSLYAALKHAGIEFLQKAVEAESVTAQPAVLRDEKKSRRKKKESSQLLIDSRFLEASRDDGIGPTKFKVALIQEGLGNLRDCYYYTRESLETAAAQAAFEGRKCYADHPSASEEQDRPERSVRDIIGHFENVHVEEAEDGSAKLVADLIMPHTQAFEWARTLVASAIGYAKKYQDRELVGLSINASGDAKAMSLDDFMKSGKLPESVKPKLMKAQEMGATQVRIVSSIRDAVSVDLVTEPGARGKILEFIESKGKENG